MPVKFKLGFTIDAKTLFGVISKFLPVEDLVVEELAPPTPEPKPLAISKPQRAPQVRKKKGSGYALNVHAGANAIIMAALSDGEQRSGRECFPAMRAAGYSTNGIYGKFKRLQRHGILETYKGLWWITTKGKALWEQPIGDQHGEK